MANKQKLLIITQKVDINDDLLGFFHGWIKEFSGHCERVTVICLEKGKYELPENVKVLSLGKEDGQSRLKYVRRFYKYIWHERKNYDKVFVHMNKEYVLLGGVLWRIWKKKIGLWYVHKRIGFKLWLAEKLADVIFTASKESFRLKSNKVKIMGHGIDIDKFSIFNFQFSNNKKFKIVYVGRISGIKNQELLVGAVDVLVNKMDVKNIQVEIVGAPTYEKDRKYLEVLRTLVLEKKLDKYINFVGSVPNKDMVKIYEQADLSINLCPTGGLDKAVLESMACGLPVLVLNKTFKNILAGYQEKLILQSDDEKELACKIDRAMKMSVEEKKEIKKELREIVVKDHSLEKLIKNIIKELTRFN